MDRADPEAALSEGASARRLYVAALPAEDGEVELGAEAARHARVLRFAVGSELVLFDGQGASAPARVVSLTKGSLRCRVVGAPTRVAPPPRVVLVQCLPKAGKLDEIVRMTTELGVARIALALSEHCVAKPRDEVRWERLRRVAIEAARQSEQPFVPELAAPAPLAAVLAEAPRAAFRAACVERSSEPLPNVVDASELWLVVGPEGGLSNRDRAQLEAANFTSIALGRSILRTETAAVVGVALALERLGRRR